MEYFDLLKELGDRYRDLEAAKAATSTPFESLPELLKKRRGEGSMTQADLALLAGVSTGVIARLEKGSTNVSLQNLLKVLNCVGVELCLN